MNSQHIQSIPFAFLMCFLILYSSNSVCQKLDKGIYDNKYMLKSHRKNKFGENNKKLSLSDFSSTSIQSSKLVKQNRIVRSGELSSGLVLIGIGYYYDKEATNMFHDYTNTINVPEALSYYDETVRLDKRASLSYGIGGGLLISALIPTYTANKRIQYAACATGTAALGVGLYYLTKANNSYQDYTLAQNRSDASNYYDQTSKLDKRSLAFIGLGGSLTLSSIINTLLNSNANIQKLSINLIPSLGNNPNLIVAHYNF